MNLHQVAQLGLIGIVNGSSYALLGVSFALIISVTGRFHLAYITTYTGAAYRTTGSAWLGVAYNPAALAVIPVGSITFSFTDPDNAVMTYDVDGVSQSKPLVRQPF